MYTRISMKNELLLPLGECVQVVDPEGAVGTPRLGLLSGWVRFCQSVG